MTDIPIDLALVPCPLCDSPTQLTERGGGWTVDCARAQSGELPDAATCPGFLSMAMDMYPTPALAAEAWNVWATNTLTLCLADMIKDAYALLHAYST